MPSVPPIGVMPPHIKPLHCVNWEPACAPLEKSAGFGCAVTLTVAVRLVPFAAAVIVALKPMPLYAR